MLGNISIAISDDLSTDQVQLGLFADTTMASPQNTSPIDIDIFNLNDKDLVLGNDTIDFGNIIIAGSGNYSPSSWSTTYNYNSLGLTDDMITISELSKNSLDVTGNLNVKSGDININGVGIGSRLDKIEERLGILRPNTELEKEFEKLKKLGNQYRKLEKKLSEQLKTWNILKEDSDEL